MDTLTTPVFAVQRAAARAEADHGWLKSFHSFSFADYFDPANTHWGSLRVFNDDTVKPGQGFGTHPHRDMEIVTYVLLGELEHKDSLGHQGVVSPGGVQYMSAGSGVTHSEFNHSLTNDVHFVQMWVMPKSFGAPPAYGQREFDVAERTGKWLTVASGEAGIDAPIELRAEATLRVARLTGGSLEMSLRDGRFGHLFVAEGEALVNGETLVAGDAVRASGEQTFSVSGTAELVAWNLPPAPVATR